MFILLFSKQPSAIVIDLHEFLPPSTGVYSALILNHTIQCSLSFLIYSTVQSPWAANRSAASQEIPRNSRNPKVHYRTQKRPPTVCILGQPNPVHIPTWRSIPISNHLRLCLPIVLLPSGFPTKTLYDTLSSPICATCPACPCSKLDCKMTGVLFKMRRIVISYEICPVPTTTK